MTTRVCLACGKKHLEDAETRCPRCGQVTDQVLAGDAPDDGPAPLPGASLVARLAALLPGALRLSSR